MSKSQQIAQNIVDTANSLGFTVQIRDEVLTITKNFKPGNMDKFVECDGQYYSILSLLPSTRPGSVWGTDGGSVGGYSAIKNGQFRMNKSGGSIRVLNAIQKLVS